MKVTRIAILLVLYNDKRHIPRLVNSLVKQSCHDFQVWALDNNSSDNSAEVLKELYPSAVVIRSEVNSGYAGGNELLLNSILKSDHSDYICVLNTDIELSGNFIEFCLNYLDEHQDCSGFAPLVYYGMENQPTEKIQCLGINTNFNKAVATLNIPNDLSESEKIVDGLPGCSFVFRTKDIPDQKLFNSEGFMYGEELDLAYRCHLHGLKLIASSNTWVWHYHDFSSRNKIGYRFQYYYMMRNRMLFFRRYALIFNLFQFVIKELCLFPFRFRWLNRLAGSKLVYYYYLGIWDGLLGKKGRGKRLSDKATARGSEGKTSRKHESMKA